MIDPTRESAACGRRHRAKALFENAPLHLGRPVPGRELG